MFSLIARTIINSMEKAILKTLIYADIFDYPLNIFEIHKWLIGKKINLRAVEKALKKLNQESRIMNHGGYYFLPKRSGLVIKRKRREKQSKSFLLKAKFYVWFLKFIPWIKLVGISGGLAMKNADKKDDIDLFLVTTKNRIWLTRLLTIFILDFLGVRRRAKMKPSQVAGKLCANILLEEDQLEQTNKDIFTAHEVLQMRVLWERGGMYGKYLLDNAWAFKFLPNWVGDARGPANLSLRGSKSRPVAISFKLDSHVASLLGMTMERLAKWLQLKIMRKPLGMERIQDGALYFHPNDIRSQVLLEFNQKVKNLISP